MLSVAPRRKEKYSRTMIVQTINPLFAAPRLAVTTEHHLIAGRGEAYYLAVKTHTCNELNIPDDFFPHLYILLCRSWTVWR